MKRFEEMLKQHDRNIEMITYPGASHAFHADSRPSYKKDAAGDPWKRCVAWFDKYLRA